MTHDSASGDKQNNQILNLLNKLGAKMVETDAKNKSTQESIERFEALIEGIEDKNERSEKLFLGLHSKVYKTTQNYENLQHKLDKLDEQHKEYDQRLQRSEALADKIEQALAQQNRLARRLEKMSQDRMRMITKLERIEDTVIDTKNSLNAKAMVLLTDKSKATEGSTLPIDPEKDIKKPANDDNFAWYEKPMVVQTGVVTALVIIAISSVWAITALSSKSSDMIKVTENNAQTTSSEFTLAEETTPASMRYDENKGELTLRFDGDDANASSETPDDIIEKDGTELLAQFNENPDQLAANLNEIAPAVGNAQDTTSDIPTATSVVVTPTITKEDILAEINDDNFVKQENKKLSDKGSLAKRIEKDSNLPAVIKEIENKAFENIPEAQHDLAAIYTAGHAGVTKDYEKAVTWFKEAAVNGVANARYNLGVMYQQGLGTQQDIDKAIEWYKAAAAQDHPEALYNLGIAYIEGIGTEYGPYRSALFFENAAQGGVVEAAYNLGLIHENGLIGPADYKEALYWYKNAADMGNQEAKKAMEQLANSIDLDLSAIDDYISPIQSKEAGSRTPPSEIITKKQVSSSEETKPTKKVAKVTPPKTKATPAESIKPEPQSNSVQSNQPILSVTPDNGQQATVAQIQEQLLRLGLYPGPTDGVNDSLTQDAIKAYQISNDLVADGRAGEALLLHLLTNEFERPLNARNTGLNPDEMLPPGQL